MLLVNPPRPSAMAIPNWSNVGNVRLCNEFVTEPLNQRIAYGKDPHGRFWFVEAKNIPFDFTDISFSSTDGEAVFTASSVGTFAPASTASSLKSEKSLTDILMSSSQRPRMPLPYNLYTQGNAEFEVTYLESWLWDGTTEAQIESLANSTEGQVTLERIRAELQAWLAASVDELAMLLNLSPTTIINLSKPGRSVRAKTVRKMSVVHGLLKELQRAIGTQAALAWAQSSGRRLLADGNLNEFEQFVSTHIFPTMARKPLSPTHFGDEEAELVVKELAPAGKASRF